MTPPEQQRPRPNTVVLIAAVGAAAMLFVMLIAVVRPSNRASESSMATIAATIGPTPTTAPPSSPTSDSALAPLRQDTAPTTTHSTPDDSPAIVTRINGVAIREEMATTMQLADAAVARLLENPVVSYQPPLLDRLINGELVVQAAHAASFTLNDATVDAALQSWLIALGKSQAELEQALNAVGMDAQSFHSYFARLLVIDRFAAQAAQSANISVADYVRVLQADAQVSLGPAAMSISGVSAADQDAAEMNKATSLETELRPTESQTSAIALRDASLPFAQLPALTGEMSFVTATVANTTEEARSTEPGRLAPHFQATLLGGDPAVSISLAELAGKPTVLSFWTTWCPYCRQQTPVLVSAQAADSSQQLNWLGVNVQESAESVASYVVENAINYPIALDTSGAIAALYAVNGYPTTYFLDAQTRIVARHLGALTHETLDGYLQLLTAQ